MMKPTRADLLFALGLVLVLAAVAVLAGGWWACGTAGVALMWSGWVQHQQQPTRTPGGDD